MRKFRVILKNGGDLTINASCYREDWGDLKFYGKRRCFGLWGGREIGIVDSGKWVSVLEVL